MGFFKKLKKVVTSPKKLSTAVTTGGLSLIAPKLTKPIEKVYGSIYKNPLQTAVAGGIAVATGNPLPLVSTLAAPQGGSNMALNLGGLLGGIGQALGGLQGQNVQGVRDFGNILSTTASFLPGPRLPQAQPNYGVKTMAAAGPIMRVGAAVTRGFFTKFPNLAVQIQAFRNAGMRQVTRSRLYSMLKRFGPELMISGGILTAAAVSELMMAGPGHRRMNAGNAKALRRSMRRIESFHRLCVRADSLRAPRRRSKGCRTSATQFVRQG